MLKKTLLIFPILFALSACAPTAPTAKTAQMYGASLALPAPIAAPTPMPLPSAENSALPGIEQYLPLGDLYVRYLTLQGESIATRVEYYDNFRQIAQRKIIQTDQSSIEILRCEDGQLLKTTIPLPDAAADYTYDYTKQDFTGGEVLLQAPIAVGTEWTVPGGRREITALHADAHVAAGVFSALEVTTTYDDGRVRTEHYLPALGLIAQQERAPDGAVSASFNMSFFEKEIGYYQPVHFYFLDMQTLLLHCDERELYYSPNTNAERRFTSELHYPGLIDGGTYIALPPHAYINSIELSERGVHVDFSEHIITNLQLGEIAERLYLQSLASTFTSHYGVDRFYISIEGEPYSSRNIALKASDYLSFFPAGTPWPVAAETSPEGPVWPID